MQVGERQRGFIERGAMSPRRYVGEFQLRNIRGHWLQGPAIAGALGMDDENIFAEPKNSY